MRTIDEKKAGIEAALRLEEVAEVPFCIEIGPFHAATTSYVNDDAAELKWNLEYHRQREAVYDYGMPNIKPNLGIGIVAEAFGCPSTPNAEADPWVAPLIREENADDVHRLALPDPETNPAFARAWRRISYLESHGELPLRMVNVPSPLVTASLIWDYTSFIEATLLFPREVHTLLEKVTEATIAYIREQLLRISRLHTRGHEIWYLPPEVGVRVSDDTAALMSPDLYREFGVKYNAMISRAFGGIVIHSCGDLAAVAPVMMETEGVRALDVTIPQNTRWDVLRDAVAGRAAILLRHFYWDHGEAAKVDLVDFTRTLVEFFGRRGVLIQTSAPTVPEAEQLGRGLHRLLGP